VAKRYLNSFASGELDPKLLGRAELDQYANGLKTGTNVLLLPQGGAKRRPGMKYLATLPGACRLARFAFNTEQEYLLVWSNLLLQVYESDALITQVVSPYTAAQVGALNWAQSADTMVVFHQDVATRRLLRGALGADPITTDGSTTTVVVAHPSHSLADGTEIGISGIDAAVGGVPVAELNTSHAIATIDGSLGSNPVATTFGSRNVVVTITAHPFVVNERVELDMLTGVGGIPASDINKVVTITAKTTNTITFVAENTADANASGGGTSGTWSAPDKYEITVTTASTSATSGGGSVGKAWALSDLTDADSGVKFENVPQFDFRDDTSPAPADEVQRIQFGGTWATGDKFRLTLDNRRTGSIVYDGADVDQNARAMQDALRQIARTVRIGDTQFRTYLSYLLGVELELKVEHETGAVGGSDSYLVTFEGNDGAKDWPLLTVEVIKSTSGTLASEEVIAGGTQLEDVFSATRGYAGAGTFYQGRLWLTKLKSRPATVLASQSQDFFNFDVSDANDGDAIDATGQSDPVLHILAERSLFLLTAGGEVTLGGNREDAITPTNIRFKINARYGTTAVRPITVGGRPIYVDRTNRNIRQLAYALESDSVESAEVSVFSQHLINTPVDMDVLRNSDADYALVVMTDGTIAAMVYNQDQAVVGWTKCETSGTVERVAVVDDAAYFAVLRTINGSSVRYLEKWDSSFYTDAAEQQSASATTSWSGFSHLEAATVSVRGDQMSLANNTVASGALTTEFEVSAIEVGLPFTTTVEPMPPVVGRKTRISRCEVDLVSSRGVLVGGFKVKPKFFPEVLGLPPLLEGLHAMTVRGWDERTTVSITQTEPQPMTVRSMLLEVE